MCFHYSLRKSEKLIQDRYRVKANISFAPVYHTNGFDTPKMPVILNEGEYLLGFQNWGLIPHWTKTLKDAFEIRTKTLNAKAETVFDLPSFKSAIQQHRCLVPADGFFEWQHEKNKTIPYFISLKDEKLFSFAGITERWVDRESGELFETFSILTTEANPFMAKIHNLKKRMPLILSEEKEELWLQKDLSREKITELLSPFPEEEMQAWQIGKLISSKTEDSNVPEVCKPLENAQKSLFD